MPKRFALFAVMALLSGCRTNYWVRSSDLDAAMLDSPRDRAPVIPAKRDDGAQVLLRTASIDAHPLALYEPAAEDHLALAGELQRLGQPRSAARQLSLFVTRLESPPSDPEQLAEVNDAIRTLQAGRDAVAIGELDLASSQPAASALRIRVQPRNGMMTAARVLAWMGAVSGLAALASFAFIALPCHGELCGFTQASIGGGFAGFGGLSAITAGILALSARHAPEAAGEPKLLDPASFHAARARARKIMIGSGISSAASAVVAVVGGALVAAANGPHAHLVDGVIVRDRDPVELRSAGWALVGIGIAAAVPSLITLAAAAARKRSLEHMERGEKPIALAPWVGPSSGGLVLNGSF